MTTDILSPTQFMRETYQAVLPAWVEARIASAANIHDGFEALRKLAAERLSVLGLPNSHTESWTLARANDAVAALQTAFEKQNSDLSAKSLGKQPSKNAALATIDLEPFFASLKTEEDTLGLLSFATAPEVIFHQVKSQVETAKEILPVTGALPGDKEATTLAYHQAALLKVEAHAEAFIVLKPGSELSGSGPGQNTELNLSHSVLYASIGAGAQVTLVLNDLSGDSLSALNRVQLNIEADAKVQVYLVSTGAKLSRLSFCADLLGSGIELKVNGLAVVTGQRQAHRHIMIRHRKPDSVSQQMFRTAVGGEARASVDGTIEVAVGAKRTLASQLLKSLLLSKSARSDSKPRLLIHNDDVKCNHGATVGKLDEKQRFYLLSRGLNEAQALELLTKAFVAAPLEDLAQGALRNQIENSLFQSLALAEAAK